MVLEEVIKHGVFENVVIVLEEVLKINEEFLEALEVIEDVPGCRGAWGFF